MDGKGERLLFGDGQRDEILGAPEHGAGEGRPQQQHVLADVRELLELRARIPLGMAGNGVQGDAQGFIPQDPLSLLVLGDAAATGGGGGGGGGGGSGGLTWVVSCGAAFCCSWGLLLVFYYYFCLRPLRVWKERGLALKGGKKLRAGVEREAL